MMFGATQFVFGTTQSTVPLVLKRFVSTSTPTCTWRVQSVRELLDIKPVQDARKLTIGRQLHALSVLHSRVEGVSEAVAEEVEREQGECQCCSGEHDDPPK